MAVVYGQILPEVGSVATYSARLREQKIAESEQRRADRIAFGQAIERKQHERVAPRSEPITRKATKSERAREHELEDRAKSTKEWKAYEAAIEHRRRRA